jgi:thiamine-monophosphate kinase
MGALPDWLLVSLILPRRYPPARRQALLAGIRAAAAAAGCRVVGGDVAVGPGPLVITVTAVGHLAAVRPLLRAGARPGDTLHTSGALGGSRLGAHLRFRPPLAAGAWLAGQPAVHAALDVSDGLLLDLATLLAASGGLGAELTAAAIPIHPAARRLAGGDPGRALDHALGDGEDHVLLWAQAPGALPRGGPLSARARRPIGVVAARPGLWLRDRNGRRRRLAATGFQHEL